jgi:protein CpxP
MRVRTFIGIAAIVLIGLGMSGLSPVWADEGYGHGKGDGKGYGRHGGYSGHGMAGHHATTGHLLRGLLMSQKEMGLTDDQVAKLKAIQLDLDKTRIKAEADIMVAEREIEALIEDEKSELAAIEEKIKQAEMLEVGLRMAAIKARREAMALLTPEQSSRVKAVHEKMMQQYKERNMEGHGMKKGGGHGGSSKGEAGKGGQKKETTP